MTNNALKFKYFLIKYKFYLFTAIIICFVLSMSLYVYGMTERGLRRPGFIFQVCGICTVILGIWDTKTYFGFEHPLTTLKKSIFNYLNFTGKLISKAKSWLCNQDHERKLTTYVGSSTSQSALKVYGPHRKYVPMKYEPGTNHTIESLAEILKENVNSLHERISKTQKEMDEHLATTTENLKREEQSRYTEDHEIREMLSGSIMGGFNISLCGAFFLLVGATLSTLPKELICIFKGDESKAVIASHPRPNLIPGINIHLI